ncbi:hypothetical protein MKW92_034245 [Papaver armeniacum]|nr:hypothetical protein MKW92_034245 [Papaver armeniacum]
MTSPPKNGDTQDGIINHVTFMFEDETRKSDCHIRLCDVKEMAAEIENEMYAEIHVNRKIPGYKQVGGFFCRSCDWTINKVPDHYVMSGHYEVPRMPGYHVIKEQILECLTMLEAHGMICWDTLG